jgi:hypothetical protein
MSYQIQATQNTPALIIYLLDVSASMGMVMGEKRRIDVMMDALSAAIRQMIFRSTKGSRLSARYRIAMYAYSDEVYDLLDGIKGIDEIARWGKLPELHPMRLTNTAKGFYQVEKLLRAEMPNMIDYPAPLVCHLTDGLPNGENPIPMAQKIMNLSTADGPVLLENIFVSDQILTEPIKNVRKWTGVLADTVLYDEQADLLRQMSSPLPESYRLMMMESGYELDSKALMMLPATSPELVSLGFQMSAATPV